MKEKLSMLSNKREKLPMLSCERENYWHCPEREKLPCCPMKERKGEITHFVQWKRQVTMLYNEREKLPVLFRKRGITMLSSERDKLPSYRVVQWKREREKLPILSRERNYPSCWTREITHIVQKERNYPHCPGREKLPTLSSRKELYIYI